VKRLGKKQRERFLRRQRAIRRSDTRQRRRLERKRRAIALQICKSPFTRNQVRLVAPAVFDIENDTNRRDLIRFLEDLRMHFKSKQASLLLIDFRHTLRFVASGTLLFYAELCRLLDYSRNVVVRCTEPQNQRASQVLQQIGVYALCHHPFHGRPTHRDVVHWRVARGHIVDASKYAQAIEVHEGKLAEPLVNGIYRGLAEAMTNVCHHAYIEQRDDGLGFDGTHDWWVFSQAKDGHLYVALCDLGIGIPRTLPGKNPGLFKGLLQRFGVDPPDGNCIAAAIEDSRSRTGKPERGKGLGDIIEAVAGTSNGIAVVFSNQGCYTLRNGIEAVGTYRDSIRGTLISWSVPLGEN
jgi:hypothetical protein